MLKLGLKKKKKGKKIGIKQLRKGHGVSFVVLFLVYKRSLDEGENINVEMSKFGDLQNRCTIFKYISGVSPKPL